MDVLKDHIMGSYHRNRGSKMKGNDSVVTVEGNEETDSGLTAQHGDKLKLIVQIYRIA